MEDVQNAAEVTICPPKPCCLQGICAIFKSKFVFLCTEYVVNRKWENKLSKFADMATYPNVFQYTFSTLQQGGFPLKGKWRTDYFRNDNPVVLELGCGKGEYTVGLAQLFPKRTLSGRYKRGPDVDRCHSGVE